MRVSGLIEGFYGRPWAHEARVEVGRWCAERGMTHYLYAPKDDPKHREAWREPYDSTELATFAALRADCGLEVGFAVSPGLSIDYGSGDDRAALAAKLDAVIAAGIGLVCLALDDIPPRPGLGEDQAALCRWLVDHLGGRAALVLVPTEYVGTKPSVYLDALGSGVPDAVPIAWTGTAVVNDRITAHEAEERAAAVGGRAPLLWDNYPVNDAVMADRLFLGPLRGRDTDLVDATSGWIANPMVQARCSKLPLASVAALLRGDDPHQVWEREAEDLGLRVFAEACDGDVPRRLVAAVAAGDEDVDLELWLQAAAVCDAPGLEDEARAWLTQVRVEADLGLRALRLLRASDPTHGLVLAAGLMRRWAAARRAPVSVMGVRFGFSPRFGQGADSGWRYLRESLQEDENAIDGLCRLALDRLAAM